ncbi:PAS domain S-box protein [Catenuloplanes atrovinosus]|uniref:histidine kinase n=1 Tax=Catenuloplanes atrovinosus TaxID=137266 RepID=A0AAE4CDD4_9ACTN|nr:PAS domain S-box protein [Catenuloplanes atrovinosus]MDR7280511.1 PAS domain S-box-containing protein [Catenuloplanes atrovinosus]
MQDWSTDYAQQLLEAAPDAIVVVTEDGRVALINAQAERLLGYQRDELLGRSVDILVPESDRDGHPRHREEYMRAARPRPMGSGTLRARRRDGSEFPAEISLSAVRTPDGLLIAAAIRDVTDRLEAHTERERLTAIAERERIEARLQQSQRLESLGQLAGGVAHDFNNLLAVVLNYIAFIAEEVGDAATEDPGRWEPVIKDIQQIQRAAERAISLTHQLLAFGRREVVKPRVLNLNTVVRDVEALLQRTIGEHVRLETSLAGDLWPIRADPGQLTQVLVNLAVNARDAMPGGGSLTIGTDNVTVDESYLASRPGLHPGAYVRLQVSDTGGGMPKEVADRAFEPFFTTKPKGEATGLGLATVYGTVAQIGGQISIYSELGVGTTISALIPASEEALPAAPDPVSSPSGGTAGRGETVLVVEDEDAMREVTQRILTRNGYTVMTAPGGDRALEVARHHHGDIHLLLSDVIMPKMLGKEVAERVTALRPGTRVLFMSGYARPVLTENGTLGDDVTLIAKPFSEHGLLRAVRAVLDD